MSGDGTAAWGVRRRTVPPALASAVPPPRTSPVRSPGGFGEDPVHELEEHLHVEWFGQVGAGAGG
jgi:hypothetical protein